MPDTFIDGFFTAAGVPLTGVLQREGWSLVTPSSDPRSCDYTHFDLSTENLGGTKRYNCWGFTFMPRRYWFGRTDVDNILADNCDPVPNGSVAVGDVIRYRTDDDVTQHTGRVWETDGAGHATLIRSKWGQSAEFIHVPLDVPSIYGANLAYFRQKAPLRGDVAETNKIADLWIKDSPGDDGEQYSGAPWWSSPDILVDVPPYDGAPDINPAFDHVNRVWARVRNRINQAIDNVYVRYYWADPSAGLAPSNWQLIPGTPGHPNPAGPLSVGPNSSAEADFVEWTPTAAPAHQCLLAIAHIDDDPRNSNNPCPISYPFGVPWDSNISQRNIHILPLETGGNGELSIGVGVPFDEGRAVKGEIHAVLTYRPQLEVMGFPRNIVPLRAELGLDGRKRVALVSLSRSPLQRNGLAVRDRRVRERPVATAKLGGVLLAPGKKHKLDLHISVPKDARRGDVYHLHIAQTIRGIVTGGYTTVIVVR